MCIINDVKASFDAAPMNQRVRVQFEYSIHGLICRDYWRKVQKAYAIDGGTTNTKVVV
jgi:hypothetical protein